MYIHPFERTFIQVYHSYLRSQAGDEPAYRIPIQSASRSGSAIRSSRESLKRVQAGQGCQQCPLQQSRSTKTVT